MRVTHDIKVCKLLKTTSFIQGLFVLALACCCLLSDVSAAPLPGPLIDPLSATIGAAGGVILASSIPAASLLTGKALIIKGLLLARLS